MKIFYKSRPLFLCRFNSKAFSTTPLKIERDPQDDFFSEDHDFTDKSQAIVSIGQSNDQAPEPEELFIQTRQTEGVFETENVMQYD